MFRIQITRQNSLMWLQMDFKRPFILCLNKRFMYITKKTPTNPRRDVPYEP